MARPMRRRSIVPGLAGLAALGFGVSHWSGPAYAVKGSWEGAPTTLKDGQYDSVLKGLEPAVSLPPITFKREGLALSVEDGRLNADYQTKFDADKTFQLRVNDEQDWRAGLSTADASLRVRGHGPSLDNLFWEASQSGSAEGVGDVQLDSNSNKEYNLTVAQERLGELLGAKLAARFRATNDGVTGRFEAHRELPGNAALSYSVENPVGVYDLARSAHVGELAVPVAGGKAGLKLVHENSVQGYHGSYIRDVSGGNADVRVSYKNDALGYNVSYARSLGDVLPVDAGVHVGVDDAGVYGKLSAHRSVSQDLGVDYEARARYELGGDDGPELAHSLKLSNKLGYAQLLHGSSGSPRLRVGYEFDA
ncbi:unnamed protein product [Polarella glacialis]|uniref:Uncharacterized protein n=1 Tax=Polarella glacialis TaxID=89957 RepID=A0A813FAD5_POLGL|nr:unnamed protein product [Polarella glacialis]CAE8621508.1 unnamed protein product [Polarella glacialis]